MSGPESSGRLGPPVGLYLHVPFCVSLCPYCDFVVETGSAARGPANRIEAYVEALAVELALRASALDARWPDRPPLGSVYLGGGTPSLLGPEAVAWLLALVGSRFGIAPDAEVTLEANPGRGERGDAAAWAQVGVTRISFGAQSMDRGELRRLGRRHDPEDVAAAVAEARTARVRSLNLDLLYDVPGQTEETWAASLEAVLRLEPDHLSLYALTLEDPDALGLTGASGDHLPVRPGARRWRAAARAEQDEDRAAREYASAFAHLASDGWRGYEISNWARPGHESRHNLAYWRRSPVEAVGPGAHAFDGEVRRWNAARLDAWMAPLLSDGGALPPGGEERLDEDVAIAEAAILALRTDQGIDAALLGRLGARRLDALDWAAGNGLTEPTADAGVRLTLEGRLLSNEIFERFI